IGLAGLNGWFAFSSIPVPSSNSVTENVFEVPDSNMVPFGSAEPVQPSSANLGTLIHLTLNAFMFANPKAKTGKSRLKDARASGFRSAHAGAIFGSPALNLGTVGVLSVSPPPNVMLPFEFQKNPFHTHFALPTGPPNTNSNPPLRGPSSGGLPPPGARPSL